MAQRKSPSHPEWPVDRSVLFCGPSGFLPSCKGQGPPLDFKLLAANLDRQAGLLSDCCE